MPTSTRAVRQLDGSVPHNRLVNHCSFPKLLGPIGYAELLFHPPSLAETSDINKVRAVKAKAKAEGKS